jgi:hypothetical protein
MLNTLNSVAQQFHDKNSYLALFLLVAIDVLLLFVYSVTGILVKSGLLEEWPPRLHIGSDWSLGEIFNYFKWSAICVVFILSFLRRPSLLIASMGLLFFVVLLDDSLMFHERAGLFLADHLAPSVGGGYLPAAVGEITFWTVMALLVVLPIAFGWRAADAALRRTVLPMGALFCGLVACGVGFDFIHALYRSGLSGALLGVLENGGEMVFASALLSYAIGAFLVGSPAARAPADL